VRVLSVSRRAPKALVENQLYVRYSGTCADVRTAIAESFTSTLTRLLHDEHGPCPPEHRCSVEHIQVVCGDGGSRRRRRLLRSTLTTDAQVTLSLSAELTDGDDGRPVNGSQLFETLDNVVDAMQTAAAERRLLPVSGDVTQVSEVARTLLQVRCRDGEVPDDDDLTACCECYSPPTQFPSRSLRKCGYCSLYFLLVACGLCQVIYFVFTDIHRVSKKCAKLFCHNFVKFPITLIIFGTLIAHRINLCHLFSTSSNSRQRPTVLNADVPRC